MAKKKRVKRTELHKPIQQEDGNFDDGDVQIDEDFFYDEIDKFHANKEKILLEAKSDDEDLSASDEEEVLAIESDDSSDYFEESENSDDDDDAGIPSEAAWGKRKSMFYGADALDGLEGSDREEAEQEEEKEVLAIQKRLAEQIDEDDLGLEILEQVGESDRKNDAQDFLKSHVVADFSALSTKAQWRLLKKESPELDGLIQDFRAKLTELETEVSPLMNLVRSGKILSGFRSDYICLKHRVYLAYLLNISFYMVLKMSKTPVQNHPVVSRLVQYRTVINQLDPIDKKLRTEIEEILKTEDFESKSHTNELEPMTNKIISDVVSDDEYDSSEDTVIRKPEKMRKRKLMPQEQITENDEDFSKSLNEKLCEQPKNSDNEIVEVAGKESEDRRAINYEIAKNKGFSQKKRKIERNPRVKMRQKFKKAKIRRRGQVREYRPEIKKYGGEASGIRIGLKKSITLQ